MDSIAIDEKDNPFGPWARISEGNNVFDAYLWKPEPNKSIVSLGLSRHTIGSMHAEMKTMASWTMVNAAHIFGL